MTRRTTIDKQCWAAFCDAYSRQHQGWIANVETYDPRLAESAGLQASAGLLPLVSNLALQGLVFEDRHAHTDLVVSVGGGENLVTHRIVEPSQIVTLQTDSGLDEGLLIHDENGGLMRIRFRAPASPEALDGITPA
jgi:hypothetical protein